jgi:predicted O-methyltransferase YrrM
MTSENLEPTYRFTNNWFNQATKSVWSELFRQVVPSRILEIGSFEGASACFMIREVCSVRPLELHCVDTWMGGREHQPDGDSPSNMNDVESRFFYNIDIAARGLRFPAEVQVHKDRSDVVLPRLIGDLGSGYFDVIYIDGSHQAPDVIFDAVAAFKLLRVGGVLIFDDYLWPGDPAMDMRRAPKLAIDAFTTIFSEKIRIISAPLYQIYVQKIGN